MSAEQKTIAELEKEVQNEYLTALHLMQTISFELHQIKQATTAGSEFEANILKNVDLVSKLLQRRQVNMSALSGEEQMDINGQANESCGHVGQE